MGPQSIPRWFVPFAAPFLHGWSGRRHGCRRHDHNAVFRDRIAGAISILVVANDGIRWDDNALVDNGPSNSTVFAYFHVFHDDGLLDVRILIDADVRCQYAFLDFSAGNNTPAGYDGIQGHAHASAGILIGKDEFGGWKLSLIGANGPGLVVQVEEGIHIDQIHVGFIVGIKRPDVPPVFHLFFVFILKVIGEDSMVLNHAGDNISSEIVGGGQAVAHRVALSKGGSNKNGVRLEAPSTNRSFKRGSNHKVVSEVSAKERKKK